MYRYLNLPLWASARSNRVAWKHQLVWKSLMRLKIKWAVWRTAWIICHDLKAASQPSRNERGDDGAQPPSPRLRIFFLKNGEFVWLQTHICSKFTLLIGGVCGSSKKRSSCSQNYVLIFIKVELGGLSVPLWITIQKKTHTGCNIQHPGGSIQTSWFG